MSFASFTEDTAEKTGQTTRNVQRGVARGKKIAVSPWLADVRGTSLDKQVEIDALLTLPADAQKKLVARAVKGEKVSAKTEAKKLTRAEKEAALGAKQQASHRARGQASRHGPLGI